MKKGKEDSGCLQPSQEEESTGSRGYSTTPASGAELTSFRPTVRQPLEDEHGMSGLSSGEEDTTLARRKVTRRREAARRIPKTLDGLQERLAGGGKLDTARKSSYLDAMFRLREELSNRTDVVFQEEDYYSIGDLLFHRIFGNDVESRLYYLIREYDAASAYRLNRAICRVDKLAEKLQHSGVDELASFVRSWGEVTHTVSSAGTSEGRLHGYWRQYDLWKRWHELKELGQVTSPKRLQLVEFLKTQNLETKQSKTLESCLADFFSRELELPGNIKFGDTIYRFTAIGMLVDAFRRGILAFLPKGLDTWYKKFRSGGKLGPKKLKLEVAC
nr:uncharacterized protein CTRU02_14203 [Colletotrichum truncatum]KAF6782556.1 hypothetical protein CTRU02_14203 [Colletotrichum truncatum]